MDPHAHVPTRPRPARAAVAGVTGLLALSGAVLAGCNWFPPHVPPPTSVPITTIPGPTTAPPTSPPTTAAPGTTTECGTIYYATGWPTTPPVNPNDSRITCLTGSFASGQSARLLTREQTDGLGGHILITTYLVTGPHQVDVTVDRTNTQDPPHDITTSRCTGLTNDFGHLETSACTPISRAG